MRILIERADSRGQQINNNLSSWFSFNFGNYINPQRESFGQLVFFNDNILDVNSKVDISPLKNLQILILPLKGSLHFNAPSGKDKEIRWGQLQIMNSELSDKIIKNKSEFIPLEFLQIGINDNDLNHTSRYEEFEFHHLLKNNSLTTIISPDNKDAVIDKNTWISIGEFNKDEKIKYELHNDNNGVFIFLASGVVNIGSQL